MQMKELLDKYYQNQIEAKKRIKLSSLRGLSDQEVLDRIQKNAVFLNQCMKEDTELLNQTIYPFIKNPEQISEEEAAEFYDLALRLHTFDSRLDQSISFLIHKALLAYYQSKGQREEVIREEYYVGMGYYYLDIYVKSYCVSLYAENSFQAFQDASEYFPQYEEITSEETRGYILRSMGNRVLSMAGGNATFPGKQIYPWDKDRLEEKIRCCNELLEVLNNPRYEQMNPKLPWDRMRYAVHANRCTALSFFRSNRHWEMLPFVLESSKYMYDQAKKGKNANRVQTTLARAAYMYYATRFHAKEITIDELMERLLDCYDETRRDDYSASAIFVNGNMPSYIIEYWNLYSRDEKWLPRLRNASEGMLEYMRKMPSSEFLGSFSYYAAENLKVVLGGDMTKVSSNSMRQILGMHPQTYVHSCMVAELSRTLAEALALEKPELFKESETVREGESIGHFAYCCGLYHDVGKAPMIDIVSVYGRRLTDEEFHIIQYHPYVSYRILYLNRGQEKYAGPALGHHQWYNMQRGYPEKKYYDHSSDPTSIFTDILAVADSMDAATDFVGRCYSQGKTMEQITEELRQGRGDRYCPAVVDLFEKETVRKQIREILWTKRKRIYCRIFRETDSAQ